MAPTTAETAAKLQAARDLLAAAEAEHAAAVENAPPMADRRSPVRPDGELYDAFRAPPRACPPARRA